MNLTFLKAIALVAVMPALGGFSFGQTTNVIPPSLFLTDNGHIFWHKSSQRWVDIKVIQGASTNDESLPADRDIERHWGEATNGFQLSLRLNKFDFTNNEPVILTLLLRNVTNSPVHFLRAYITHRPSPINVLLFQNNQQLKVKDFQGGTLAASGGEATIYPQAQLKFRVVLNDYYDLSVGGEFSLLAECDSAAFATSTPVKIRISAQ